MSHRYNPDTQAWSKIPETIEDKKIRETLEAEDDTNISLGIRGSYGITTYKPEPPCHTNGKVIFQAHGIKVRASAGSKGIHNLKSNELLLDLLNGDITTGPLSIYTGQDFGEWLQPHLVHRLRIDFDWPDMSVVNLPKKFWLDLIKHCQDNKYDIHVACFGGHGRTGTVLAILAGLMGVTKTDPVKFVREKHCKNAVESESQITMIEKITGIKVLCVAGKGYYSVYDSATVLKPLPQANDNAKQKADLPILVCEKCNILLATSQTKCTCGGKLVAANLSKDKE